MSAKRGLMTEEEELGVYELKNVMPNDYDGFVNGRGLCILLRERM
jgi:hypothetical protein